MLFSFFQQSSGVAPQQKETQIRQHHSILQAEHLIGHDIRVNRGGPDSVTGVLLAIPGDFLVVLSDNTIVFVNGAHVKSITEGMRSGGNSGGKSGSQTSGRRVHKSFISAPTFQRLLSRLRHKHIQINRGGPEKLDGFLAEVSTDNVLMIVDRELVRIPIFHIKTVSVSRKNNKNNNSNNKSNNQNKSGGNKSNNKSGGNKSGSKKSGGNKSGGNRTGGINRSGNKNRSGGQGKNKGNGRR